MQNFHDLRPRQQLLRDSTVRGKVKNRILIYYEIKSFEQFSHDLIAGRIKLNNEVNFWSEE